MRGKGEPASKFTSKILPGRVQSSSRGGGPNNLRQAVVKSNRVPSGSNVSISPQKSGDSVLMIDVLYKAGNERRGLVNERVTIHGTATNVRNTKVSGRACEDTKRSQKAMVKRQSGTRKGGRVIEWSRNHCEKRSAEQRNRKKQPSIGGDENWETGEGKKSSRREFKKNGRRWQTPGF